MANTIFSEFTSLAVKDRNIPNNQLYVGENVDIHSDPGYMKPSLAVSSVQDTTGSVLRSIPVQMVADPTNGKAYIIALNGDLYQMTISNDAFNADFDGGGHYYKAITSFASWAGAGRTSSDLIIFNGKLVYSYNTSNHAYAGTYDLTSTFDDTDLDLGSAATSYGAPHPMMEWKSYLWIANGQYLARSSDAASVSATYFDLGAGWQITSLFPTKNYIGICAWKRPAASGFNLTECRIFFYDGTNTNWEYSVAVDDTRVFSSINYNGEILLSTSGKNNGTAMIRRLTNEGTEVVKRTKLVISGSELGQGPAAMNGMSICQNKVFLCLGDSGATIATLGDEYGENPFSFAYPYLLSSTTANYPAFIKQISASKLYIGWRSSVTGNGSLSSINLGGSTYNTATYKSGYVDFGQKIVLKSIELFFKPLVSGDSITVGVDTDYGTANSIQEAGGVVSYARNGAITYKKFDLASRECHAFRPTISWTAGKTAISKIVVTYDFINN